MKQDLEAVLPYCAGHVILSSPRPLCQQGGPRQPLCPCQLPSLWHACFPAELK